jgi:hypothetical protein
MQAGFDSRRTPRAMAAWFLDKDHIVVPVVDHRLCIDYFLHHASWLLALATFFVAIVAVVLGVGASWYPLVIGTISAAIVLIVWYGEWALSHKRVFHSYIYLVLLYLSTMVLLWAGAMGYVDTKQVRSVLHCRTAAESAGAGTSSSSLIFDSHFAPSAPTPPLFRALSTSKRTGTF